MELLPHQNIVKFIAKTKAKIEAEATLNNKLTTTQEEEEEKSNIFKPFLGAITPKICNAMQVKGVRVEKSQIKPTNSKTATRDNLEVGLQYCKVSLPDVPLSQALDLVCNVQHTNIFWTVVL
jgi:hypothetical protein